MEEFEPEIGQAIFGQPTQEFECPQILDAALMAIRDELQRVLWNLRHTGTDPFANRSDSFKCETFCVCSYSWGDDPQPWNFKHYASGIEVSWYKYFGRGMSVNKAVMPDDAASLLGDCLAALLKVEKGEIPYSEPGLYPDGATARQ